MRKRKRMKGYWGGFNNDRYCFYCEHPFSAHGERMKTKDHVFPKCGKHGFQEEGHPFNTVNACSKCNNQKGDMHPKEWMWMISGDAERFVSHLKILCVKDWVKIDESYAALKAWRAQSETSPTIS